MSWYICDLYCLLKIKTNCILIRWLCLFIHQIQAIINWYLCAEEIFKAFVFIIKPLCFYKSRKFCTINTASCLKSELRAGCGAAHL